LYIKKIREARGDSNLILLHHQGLGDAIVCNGMVNILSTKFDKIFLAINERYFDQINFLYSKNSKIEIFSISSDIDKNLLNFSEKNNVKILKVGFENRKKGPFNTQLYKQLRLNYKISFKNFYLPEDHEKSNLLESHLFKYYKIVDEFILVHKEADKINYPIELNSNISPIYVEKESDLFGNMFLYTNLIKKALEIHCVDSSFIHLVERIDTSAKLYYHTNRNSNIFLSKNWTEVNYGN